MCRQQLGCIVYRAMVVQTKESRNINGVWTVTITGSMEIDNGTGENKAKDKV